MPTDPTDRLEATVARYAEAMYSRNTEELAEAAWRLYAAHGYPLGKSRLGLAVWLETERWTTTN